jgi:hypothetical protein
MHIMVVQLGATLSIVWIINLHIERNIYIYKIQIQQIQYTHG